MFFVNILEFKCRRHLFTLKIAVLSAKQSIHHEACNLTIKDAASPGWTSLSAAAPEVLSNRPHVTPYTIMLEITVQPYLKNEKEAKYRSARPDPHYMPQTTTVTTACTIFILQKLALIVVGVRLFTTIMFYIGTPFPLSDTYSKHKHEKEDYLN